jgi:hypothetical protein
LAQLGREIISNRTGYGGKIWNPEDDFKTMTTKFIKHISDAGLVPTAVWDGVEFVETVNKPKEQRVPNELLMHLGDLQGMAKLQRVDTKKALYYTALDYAQSKRDIAQLKTRREFNKRIQRAARLAEMCADLYDTGLQGTTELEETLRSINIRKGTKRGSTVSQLEAAQFSKFADDIANGDMTPVEVGVKVLDTHMASVGGRATRAVERTGEQEAGVKLTNEQIQAWNAAKQRWLPTQEP